MLQDIKITIIQSPIIWENITANIEMFDKKIDSIAKKTDLILLPEMFTTGFTMNAKKLAESMNGKTVNWLKKKARAKNTNIAGTIIIKETGKFFNRFIWANPKGKIITYNKKHLFGIAKEDKIYTPGNKKRIVNLKEWKIALFICYDLRFPKWSANINTAYDIAIYAANWPSVRSYAWNTLLCARAIENQSYTIGINRIKKDGNNILYPGNSKIIDFLGYPVFNAENKEIIHTQTLKFAALHKYRQAFPALKNAYTGKSLLK